MTLHTVLVVVAAVVFALGTFRKLATVDATCGGLFFLTLAQLV